VTHETGFSQTLTAIARVPEPAVVQSTNASPLHPDPDDSWFAGVPHPAADGRRFGLSDGRAVEWEPGEALVAGRALSLRFLVMDKDGSPAKLEPYLSMLGHVAIRRDDGTVFTHLHPAGSLSVAAQQVFQIRAGENPPKRITPAMMEKLCQAPGADLPQQPLSFPYEFPKAGRYRIWVQAKMAGTVQTAVFDAHVSEAR
jgi:hypothetical protein